MMRKIALALPAATVVVAIDQWTKRWALDTLPGNPREIIPGILSFEYTRNSGVAFGLFQNGGVLLPVAVLIAIGMIFWMITTLEFKVDIYALGAILGGAVGNVVDRLLYADAFLDGAVVDWIKLPKFWNFNIADAALTIGVAGLVVSTWLRRDVAN